MYLPTIPFFLAPMQMHMTLTRFFTRYVYIPMGGSRKGKIRTYVNTLVVFLLSGLWHGPEWSFMFWGLLHGMLMVAEKIGKDLKLGFKRLTTIPRKVFDGIRWLVTFLIINITWIFFRAEDMEHATWILRGFLRGGMTCHESIMSLFQDLIEIRILKRFGLSYFFDNYGEASIWGFLILLVMGVVCLKNTQEKMLSSKYTLLRSLVTVGLIVWCVVSLSDVSVFLYFDF